MKAFIITLSKLQNSLYHAVNLYNNLKSVGVEPTLFEGTYGEDAETRYAKEGRTRRLAFYDGKLFHTNDTPGVKGCFDSHYRLWKLCVELNEPILVFEDDVKLYRGFNCPTWDDVLILSLCTEWTGMYDAFKHHLDHPHKIGMACRYNAYSMPGTSGYAIKPHAAAALVNEYRNTYMPSDHAMRNGLVKLQIHSQLMGRSLTESEGKLSLTWRDLSFQDPNNQLVAQQVAEQLQAQHAAQAAQAAQAQSQQPEESKAA
jgi:glycosyl transferase family 25